MTLKEIRAVLAARGLSPLKQLGQNFLYDQNLLAWMKEVIAAGVAPGGRVVEIGPGLGALTEGLLKKEVRLIALEKDRGLCVFLREKFAAEIASGKFILQEGDALELLPAVTESPEVICGNLPYYISTPLLMECLHRPGPPTRLVFLLQKEVGQRLASPPEGKIYGALSVVVQVNYRVEVLRNLPGSVFYPEPEVGSVVVQLTPLEKPLLEAKDRVSFTKTVQRGFSQRRKKLSNLLPTKDGRRAEHLSPTEWVQLWWEVSG